MKIPNILIGLQDIKRECSWIAQILFLLRRLTQIGCCLTVTALAESPETSRYPGASHVPDSQPGWEAFVTKVDPNAAKDEPQGGRTAQGTPVEKTDRRMFSGRAA